MKKIASIFAAFAMMTGSAIAADWNFYGSARVSTFYTDHDSNTNQYEQGLQSNSRIGAKVTVSDELSGRFEYGTSDDKANVRLLYGTWNFGAGELTVGKDYTPAYLTLSNQVYGTDNGLDGYGETSTNRLSQIKLTFGDFEVAVVETETDFETALASDSYGETKVTFPRIEAAYHLKGDTWFTSVAGAFQTFEADTDGANGGAWDVDTYYLRAIGGINVGAFAIKAGTFYGQNANTMISTIAINDEDSNYGTRENDLKSYGFQAQVEYTVNDMLGLEAGIGYQKDKDGNLGDKTDDVVAYYLSAPVTMAPGVFFVPEVGMVDYKDSTVADRDFKYVGAKWQINF